MVITDPAAPLGMMAASRGALDGGATVLQLRWKEGSAAELLDAGRMLVELTKARGALLIVNDRLDVALACGADGVHLGADDIPPGAARELSPAGFLIGCSVDTPDEAVKAVELGADYLGAGPVYETSTKTDTGPILGPAGLAEIAASVTVPVLGIGGIGLDGIEAVMDAGAAGIATIGAVTLSDDPADAASRFIAEMNSVRPA